MFKELQKGGVFKKYSLNSLESYKKSIISIKDFFGSYSLKTISQEVLLGVPFRKYKRENTNLYNLAAILKIGERKAKNILRENTIGEYSKEEFISKLRSLKELSNKKPKEFLPTLQKECLKAGVVAVYVPNMSNTYFGGATLWINKYPVILLKAEEQYEDIFWFNFFHEAGHVLKHSKKEVFISFDPDRCNRKDDIEIEADNFASEILMPNFEDEIKKIKPGVPQDELINIISKKYKISKSIVAGRLCYDLNRRGMKDIWEKLSDYRPIIKEKITFTH